MFQMVDASQRQATVSNIQNTCDQSVRRVRERSYQWIYNSKYGFVSAFIPVNSVTQWKTASCIRHLSGRSQNQTVHHFRFLLETLIKPSRRMSFLRLSCIQGLRRGMLVRWLKWSSFFKNTLRDSLFIFLVSKISKKIYIILQGTYKHFAVIKVVKKFFLFSSRTRCCTIHFI